MNKKTIKTKLPKGLKKRIRIEKARARREGTTLKEVGFKIEEMYKKIISKKR